MPRLLAKTATLLATATLSVTALAAPGLAAPGAPSPAARLNNAPIPASCEHPATTLNGTKKTFGANQSRGFAQLVTKFARTGHLKGHAGKVTVVPLVCSAGGVIWPEYLLTYGKGNRLLKTIPLGNATADQEHEDVTALRFSHGKVQVSWHGYNGAGFTITPYRGTIGWAHKHETWKNTGPLTIDWADDQSQSPEGASISVSTKASYMLSPAPKTFRTFIQHVWNKDYAAAGQCAADTTVNVQRYSHLGFAVGGEGGCGGAGAIWARVGGKWKNIEYFQDYPECSSLTKLQHRAYVALGQTCWDPKTQKTVTLGDWPKSGV